VPEKKDRLEPAKMAAQIFWTSASLFACAEWARPILGHYRNFFEFRLTSAPNGLCEFWRNIRADF